MPEQIINFTPGEWGQAQKRKAAKLRNAVITGSIVFAFGCGFGYWALWEMVHK
jgi:hypothetical protein